MHLSDPGAHPLSVRRYSRWIEGRQIWTIVITNCRDLVRLAIANIADVSRVDVLSRHVIAYAVLLKQHLRGERDFAELEHILSHAEMAAIGSSEQCALAVVELLSQELVAAQRAGLMDSRTKLRLESNLSELTAALGSAERILNTRMPFGYIVHMRTFMILWLLALPYGLVEDLGWAAAPVAVVVAYLLLGVERVSLEIEQPFGTDYSDLALEEFVHGVTAGDILEMLTRHVPKETRFPGLHTSRSRERLTRGLTTARNKLRRASPGLRGPLVPQPEPETPPGSKGAGRCSRLSY